MSENNGCMAKKVFWVNQNKIEYWAFSNSLGWQELDSFDDLPPSQYRLIEIRVEQDDYDNRMHGFVHA